MTRWCELTEFTRKEVWTQRRLAEIPDDLFDMLDELHPPLSVTQLAYVGLFLSGGGDHLDAMERCPHCGKATRYRYRISEAAAKVVNEWLASGDDGTSA